MSGFNTGAVLEGQITHRGTSNTNVRGSAETRRRRRAWLVETYRADVDVLVVEIDGAGELVPVPRSMVDEDVLPVVQPACRCYRCGRLLTVETVTVDRIIPGCKGGTYARNNIRPACGHCNSSTGQALAVRSRS